MNDESIIEKYLSTLNSAEEIGKYLETFYSTLFKLVFSSDRVKVFYRLVRGYGRRNVFFAIVDIYNFTKEVNHDSIYPLLVYICKKSLLANTVTKDTPDLTEQLEDIMDRIEKQKKKKLNFPKEEE